MRPSTRRVNVLRPLLRNGCTRNQEAAAAQFEFRVNSRLQRKTFAYRGCYRPGEGSPSSTESTGRRASILGTRWYVQPLWNANIKVRSTRHRRHSWRHVTHEIAGKRYKRTVYRFVLQGADDVYSETWFCTSAIRTMRIVVTIMRYTQVVIVKVYAGAIISLTRQFDSDGDASVGLWTLCSSVLCAFYVCCDELSRRLTIYDPSNRTFVQSGK